MSDEGAQPSDGPERQIYHDRGVDVAEVSVVVVEHEQKAVAAYQNESRKEYVCEQHVDVVDDRVRSHHLQNVPDSVLSLVKWQVGVEVANEQVDESDHVRHRVDDRAVEFDGDEGPGQKSRHENQVQNHQNLGERGEEQSNSPVSEHHEHSEEPHEPSHFVLLFEQFLVHLFSF